MDKARTLGFIKALRDVITSHGSRPIVKPKIYQAPENEGPVSNKEDIKLLNSDIRYIKTKSNLQEKGNYFYNSKLFWIVFILPILLLIALLIYLKIISKTDENSIFNKSRKATKLAQKRLKTAQKHLKSGNKELFFEEVEKSLWWYIADKFSVEVAQLS